MEAARRFFDATATAELSSSAGQLARMGHYRTGQSAVVIAERLRSLTSFGDPPSGPAKVAQHLHSGTDPGGLLLSLEGLVTIFRMAESE
jgi:hypothetical protein